MRRWIILVVGVATIVLTAVVVPTASNSRSARPVTDAGGVVQHPRFKREESAALFVGVRRFTQGRTVEVPYAADDAVDLAYLFALDRRVSLVLPQRVVLALSGRPQKEESKRRLQELEDAGARVAHAGQSDILALLQQQAAMAGKGGVLIVSLATHGFVRDGVPYVFGSDSLIQFPQTALSAAQMIDVAAASEAGRSLILVDACRERLSGKTRAGVPDPSTAAPPMALVRGMERTQGQVIFYAAAAGQYAYDDDVNRNGVFTKAVIDGLHCEASSPRGIVTATTLESYVDRQVRDWIRRNRKSWVGSAIQVSMDGDARGMPLSCCREPCHVQCGPITALRDGSTLTALDADGSHLWQRDVGAPITQLEVIDLDGDRREEIVLAAHGARDRIIVFDHDGNRLGFVEEAMTLHSFVTGHLFGKGRRHIVALWSDKHSSASYLSVYAIDGQLLSSYKHRGRLQYVTIDRPTNRHAPKIIVAGVDEQGVAIVFVFDPKKIGRGNPLWYGTILPSGETIQGMKIVASGGQARRAIAISTASGNTL